MRTKNKETFEFIVVCIIWLLCVTFTLGIIFFLFAIPTYCIIEIINAIKK